MNNFKNGYTCKKCMDKYVFYATLMTPVYFRINKKFCFAGLVKCSEHGITEAIALRDL